MFHCSWVISSRPDWHIFPYSEIASISTQTEKLHIDVHTQSLRIKVERVKRQKWRSTLKLLKRDAISPSHILAQTRHEIAILQDQLKTLRTIYESEIAWIETVSNRCFPRIYYKLFISIAPYVFMPAVEHNEVSQLIYEFLRTTQQLKTPYDVLNSIRLSQKKFRFFNKKK